MVFAGLMGLVWLAMPAAAAANTYYVMGSAVNASDNNAGTQSSPWRTIGYGTSHIASGDTLIVGAGTYVQQTKLTVSTSNITLKADTSAGAVIISGDTNGDGIGEVPAHKSYTGLVCLNGNNITFEGFEVAYSGERGVQMNGSGVVVKNCNMHNNWTAGAFSQGPNNTLSGNLIWRNADSNYCDLKYMRQCNGDWGAGVGWGVTQTTSLGGVSLNFKILNNKIYNNSGEGLCCMHNGGISAGDGGLVQGNIVYDNWAQGIYFDQCSHVVVDRNLAYYTDDKNWWRDSSPRGNINIANEYINSDPVMSHDFTVTNNIAIGGGTNIGFWQGYIPSPHLDNSLFANNTLINPRGSNISFGGSGHVSTRVTNNISILGGSGSQVSGGSGIAFDHNLWWGGQGIAGTGDINTDPKLVNLAGRITAGGVDAKWYQLTSLSPAINTAVALTAVTQDYWGVSRPIGGTSDIGAHEYGTALPSPTGNPSGKPGDANGDGKVDDLDYLAWAKYYGLTNATGATQGDFNGDKRVDDLDYVIWVSNYGK